jgi:hypothetical protein
MFPLSIHAGRTAAIVSILALAACGGGGGASQPPPDGPAIQSFTAAQETVFVGEETTLTGHFSGGTGRLDGGMVLQSGEPVGTGPLDRPMTFVLSVEAAGKPTASKSVSIDTRFRDRYVAAGNGFTASQHSATLTVDGDVLFIGGSRGESVLSSAIDRFDPATGAIQRIGNLNSGRSDHVATRLPGGRIVLTGGLFSFGDPRSVEVVDEATGEVTSGGFLSTTRLCHAGVLLRDGRVLVSGGNTTGEGNPLGISDSAEIWDPATRTARKLTGHMRLPRSCHTMTALKDGRVLIVGGYTSQTPYELAEIFDPATETFSAVSEPAPAQAAVQGVRAYHAAHLDAAGGVLVLGGETLAIDGQTIVPINSVLRFDAATNQFTQMPSLAVPRTMFASVMLPTGEVRIFGGQTTVPDYTATAERYTPNGAGGALVASMPAKRVLHAVTRLHSGKILVSGGEMPGGAFTSDLLVYE